MASCYLGVWRDAATQLVLVTRYALGRNQNADHLWLVEEELSSVTAMFRTKAIVYDSLPSDMQTVVALSVAAHLGKTHGTSDQPLSADEFGLLDVIMSVSLWRATNDDTLVAQPGFTTSTTLVGKLLAEGLASGHTLSGVSSTIILMVEFDGRHFNLGCSWSQLLVPSIYHGICEAHLQGTRPPAYVTDTYSILAKMRFGPFLRRAPQPRHTSAVLVEALAALGSQLEE